MMWQIFRLELRVAFRHSAEIANPLWFFLIVITLFPLSIGPEPQLLARIVPGIIWVAALLSSLLALERLFRDDLQDGSLEQLMLLPLPLPAVVLAKVMAHWVVTGLPLTIPLLIFATAAMDAASMHLPVEGYMAILGALLAGSATLSPFATAAALRISMQ